MSIITFVPLLISAWASLIEGRYLPLPGLVGTVLCFVTVFCTAMIYASLKSVQAWHTRLTPLCYLLFSAAGGFVLVSFFALAGGGRTIVVPALAVLFLAGAWVAKLFWRNRMRRLVPLSTPETATGLGNIGHVRLFERPHVTENYLTREMGFRVARKHADKLWRIALALGGVVPALLLIVLAMFGGEGGLVAGIAALAALMHATGIFVERWLFFAEARHAVMNYYGG